MTLPFIFRGTDHMHRVMDGPIGEDIRAAFEPHGFIGLGCFDGAENNWPSFEPSGHFEVTGPCTLNEHLIVPEMLVMSKASWDKLTPEDQALVRQAVTRW